MNHASQLTKECWGDLLACVKQLCRVYWGPSQALCREVVEGSFLQPFEALAPLVGANADAELTALRTLLDGFSGAESLLANLEAGYVRLFVNDRGGVAAPLYASCYEDQENPQLMGAPAVRMQKLLADLKVHMGAEVCEPPDHLAIELEVLYFLLTRDIAAGRPAVLAAAADFATGEMLPWVQAFRRHLAGEVQCRFYPLITDILLSLLRALGTYSDPGLGKASQ
jgi:TorA-specific chaperone